MRRTVWFLVAALAAAPQIAAADTLFGGTFGGFIPRGQDSRVTGDVLTETFGFRNGFRTLWDDDEDKDPIRLFGGPSISGEVLFGIGDFVEAGRYRLHLAGRRQLLHRLHRHRRHRDRAGHADAHRSAEPHRARLPDRPHDARAAAVGGGINFYRWHAREAGSSSTSPTPRCRCSSTPSPTTARRRRPRALRGPRADRSLQRRRRSALAGWQRRRGAGTELRRRQAGSRWMERGRTLRALLGGSAGGPGRPPATPLSADRLAHSASGSAFEVASGSFRQRRR